MKTARRILLTGFMGAGKTTVARALARLLGGDCVSTDDLVTRHEGRTPQALIDEEGEAAFREAETRALARALAGGAARVIDAGGGLWSHARNRALAAEHDCLTVWLDAPFDLCWQRIEGEPDVLRPLARERARAAALYEQRRPSYRLAALRVRVTPERDAADLAAEIVASLESPDRCPGNPGDGDKK